MNENDNKFPCVTVHQSLTKPHLMAGCDRELFLLLSLVCALIIGPLGFLALNPTIGVSGMILLTIGKLVLGYMGKVDPLARTVYQRALAYKDFYPAKTAIKD